METPRTIRGRFFTSSSQTDTAHITVWFAHQPVDGDGTTVETVADAHGRFVFDLPPVPLRSATIGASIEGVTPVDLEPNGGVLEPGDLVLVIDDGVPSHLRYGGLP